MSRGATRETGMSARNDDIRLLLLAMLAEGSRVDCAIMGGLGPDEWASVSAMARQHRLEPLLHRHLDSNPQWPVPSDIRRRWQRSYRRSACRALASERVISRIAARFDQAGIPHAALKGAWLARHAYAHPALRPLRDIDILVPARCAMAAFDLLRREGFVPRNSSEPTPEYALVHGKHLPGLVWPADNVSIEIHHRLFTPSIAGVEVALATDDVLSRRVVAISNAGSIAYLDPTDTLLHLAVHSVYEHELCNGPLVLTDVALLLGKAEVDWDRLWREAARGGWADGCNLLLAAVERYHRVCIPRPRSITPPPESLVQTAALLMLQDHQRRGRVALLSSLGAMSGLSATLRLAASRARPEGHSLAGFAGIPAARGGSWALYPHWLASRFRLTLAALADKATRADIGRARVVKHWLGTRA